MLKRMIWQIPLLALLLFPGHQLQASTVSIMPLGDSLTAGLSTYENSYSYRNTLNALLSTYDFSFVGSQHSGSFSNNAHEGNIGATIQNLWQYNDPTYTTGTGYLGNALNNYNPDVVLLHIGTNNIWNDNPSEASWATINVLHKVFSYDPTTKVIIAQIINAKDSYGTFGEELDYRL